MDDVTKIIALAGLGGAVVGTFATVLIIKCTKQKIKQKKQKQQIKLVKKAIEKKPVNTIQQKKPAIKKFGPAKTAIPIASTMKEKDPAITYKQATIRRMDTPYNPSTKTNALFKKRNNPFGKKFGGLGSLNE